ncbi:glycosyl hydrolase family 8 [Chryseosolibacter indicus]|uniref:cellulase n=1 Tax=Chryseosolibacter indicus TaxID=2782351 RepID=A0ABS5VQW2_9BACT|nr:glycosyl hydrolase family 8 [Chryseosolibacter indicus]MBT1703803.1 hypothetical protein [Chryseosolibacter indicus]
MKKMAIYLLLFPVFLILGCDKEEDDVNISDVEIKVTNTAGVAQPSINVYLLKATPLEAEGSNATNALKAAVTDVNGIANFDMSTLTSLKNGEVVYFTALEKTATGDYNVIGSIDWNVDTKDQTVRKTIVISESDDSGTITPYAYGFLPSTISSTLAMSEYDRWKRLMVVTCSDGLRVVADPSTETKVEAIGFGMLLAAYAKDRATFDGIHRFYNSKRTAQAKNMMAWSVTCNGIIDPGSATDGDLDVAFALIVAYKQWDAPSYLDAAKSILKIIRDNLVKECSVNDQSVLIVGPGYNNIAWGGCQEMDIMYHTPAFFRVFAEVTGDNTWNNLADDTYITLNASAHPVTGLVPDWQTATGTPGPNNRAGHYGYDACRAPWRITLDYLWNGNDKAEAWSRKISNWASLVGPSKIVDGYELNGTPRGTNGLNSAFLGGFAVAAMANSQTTVNTFGQELSKLNDTYWFNLNTRCLYLFTLSGKFWDPLKK